MNGLKTFTYKITYSDGSQTNKQLLSSTITTSPVTRVVTVGAKKDNPVVAGASTSKTPPAVGSTDSTGETLGVFAVLGGIVYVVLKLGKAGITRIKSN